MVEMVWDSYRLCACKCQGWNKAKISRLLLQPNHSPLPHSSLFPAFWRETQSSACGRPCCVSTVNLKSSHLLCLLIPKANRNALEGQRTSALWNFVHGHFGHVWALIIALRGRAVSGFSSMVIAILYKNLFLWCYFETWLVFLKFCLYVFDCDEDLIFVFAALNGNSLAPGAALPWGAGSSLWWLLLLRSMGFKRIGFNSCLVWAQ